MAIVEMKRVRLLGMAADKDNLLRIMQRFGCVQITAVEEDAAQATRRSSMEASDTLDRLSRIQWAIGRLNRYDTTKVSFLNSFSMPEATAAEADAIAENEPKLMAVVDAAEMAERQSGDLKGQETRIRAQIDQLLPWRALDVPMEKIHDTRDTLQYIGTVNNRSWPVLEEALVTLPATLERIGDERDQIFIWIVSHRDARSEVLEALKAADFSAVSFAGERGTIAQLIDTLNAELSSIQKKRDAIEETFRTLATHISQLKLLYEIESGKAERETAGERFIYTQTAFLMEGWIPANAAEKLEKKLRSISPDLAIEFRDPRDDEKPPTLLHNNKVVAPFETVLTSYSYPDPRGLDPTAIMAPFFACLFGMMLSDAGYGLVLVIAIPLALHFLKPKEGMRKLMNVLFWGGVFTVFWGFMFDTWFGASIKPMLINMLEQPIEMMMLCLGIGALHLFTGLGVAAYMNIRRGKILDAVFDQLLWVILIVGLPLMLLPATATIGKWMAIGGVVGILLTAGRAKPSLVGKLLGGGGALYNISSWLSDLLSYMRLFGMGLATGVIGMVFNMLAGLILGNGIIGIILGVVVLVIGHVFNFAINALGAYVHSCRLQYIEFFSKFYEDGGDPFTPLAQKPLYIAIRDTGADSVE